jgi:hypothetical protein
MVARSNEPYFAIQDIPWKGKRTRMEIPGPRD